MQAYREHGMAGLKAKPNPGQRQNCRAAQERKFCGGFAARRASSASPRTVECAAGYASDRAQVHKKFNSHYINQWLAVRRITPQNPSDRLASGDNGKCVAGCARSGRG